MSVSRDDSRSPVRRKRSRSRSYSRSRSRSRSYSSYSSRSGSRSPVRETNESKIIEISKLTKNVTSRHLREIFGAYGEIRDIDLPIVRRIGSHRGTAVITFETGKAAQKAISHMDRGQLDGSLISVRMYRPPSPPRGPAALRGPPRNGNGYRVGPNDHGNRFAQGRPFNSGRRNSPPRRPFISGSGGRSRSPPRRDFGGGSRAPAGRPGRSRSPPSRRRRSVSRSVSRSPRRGGARRPSPQYGGRRSPPPRGSRRIRSYSRSSQSSYSRSSRSRSRSPRGK
ncbi:hypothetical protein CROQUDRAFT_46772 [Cronartium quercuum f. sp. fusiforme G11]|uniref:RRM domain-containing protein n=1 Tax=Cronartium quercuum f. sp. fusiforme G11 TaxID=708437 RepID=A0A9P6TAN3_9BASI|nr:hypothetical protein CROQUDRAFT_46772 [Cronartium quercuum f. sp. fusiforme G11]